MINAQPVRLVALDLDGTLMGHDLIIRPRVRQAIAQIQAQGVHVTLATGRMFSATAPFAQQLDVDTPLICYQGAWVQALKAPVLHRTPLPLDHARAALALGRAQMWHTVLYADGRLFIDAMVHSRSFYETLLGPEPTVEPHLERVLDARSADKVLFVADSAEIPMMARTLHATFDGKAEVVQSHAQFVEVVPQGVDKGQALAWLASRLAVPREAVMAVGDQQNDLQMIEWAGIGVAMGNAVPSVRQAADWIAPSLQDDGAAVALERFVLRKEAE